MSVGLAAVKPILRIKDICELLGISESKFFELKNEGRFGKDLPTLVVIQPQIDRSPRFSGTPFVEWLSEKNQLALLRATLREAK